MLCPHCGEESFAKKKKLTENWKVTGEIEVCALCGKEWKTASSGSSSCTDEKVKASRNRLAALLGGEEIREFRLSGSADRRFCRNCQYFMQHPFKTVCALSDRETDPMGECERFECRKDS